MAVLLGDRRLTVPGLAAFLISSAGAAPFAGSACGIDLPAAYYYLVPLCGATALLLIGPWLDRRIRLLPIPGTFLVNSELVHSPTLIFSFAATTLTAAVWLPRLMMPTGASSIWPAAAIGGLLFAHSLVWVRKPTSWVCVAFIFVEGLHCGLEADLSVWSMSELATYIGDKLSAEMTQRGLALDVVPTQQVATARRPLRRKRHQESTGGSTWWPRAGRRSHEADRWSVRRGP